MVDSFVTCGIIVLNISLFLATTTSVQLVDALRQLHVPKTFVQTIDITLKYSYILENTFTNKSSVSNFEPLSKSEPPSFGSLLVSCISQQRPYQRGLRGHVAERIWHGQETKSPSVGKRRWPFTTGISLPIAVTTLFR